MMVHGHRARSRIRTQVREVLSSAADIQRSAILFFQDILYVPSQSLDLICPYIIPWLLTEADNIALNHLPLIHEVQEVLFSIDTNSITGLDGFLSLFFQHCWDIIQEDVYSAIIDFFEGGHLLCGLATTSIILLLKGENSYRWTYL